MLMPNRTFPTSTVLVTGAAGFVGSHLTERLLTDGHSVVGLDNFNDFYDPDIKRANLGGAKSYAGFTMVEGDIRDEAGVDAVFDRHRPDAVVHLAAMAGVRSSIERPHLYTDVNVQGTTVLLDAAARHGTGPFVFASSSSVYGNNAQVPFSEAHRVENPISPYAATKRAAELLCHTFHHLHGLPVVCLRLFTVFGPRQRPDLAIAKFLRLVASGDPIPVFGDGTTSRDYTYVDDIVNGVVGALSEWSLHGGFDVFNLGGSHPVTLNELIAIIEEVTGLPVRRDNRPPQPGDVQRTWADVGKAAARFGFEPSTGLREGIAAQWEWVVESDRAGS